MIADLQGFTFILDSMSTGESNSVYFTAWLIITQQSNH